MKTSTTTIRQPHESEMDKLLADIGTTVVLSNCSQGCAVIIPPENKAKPTVHRFSSEKAFDDSGKLSPAGLDEVIASGVLEGPCYGAHFSRSRLIARGALTAALAGALTLGTGVAEVSAANKYPYYGGTNPMAQVLLSQPKPAFVDIDGDGDMDCFIGDRSGDVNFYLNQGQPGVPDFKLEEDGNPLSSTQLLYYAAPTFVDIDGDGDMDAFIGSSYYYYDYYNGDPDEEPKARRDGQYEFATRMDYFKNVGTKTKPVFEKQAPENNPLDFVDLGYAAPTFADLDGDGDMDAFIGGGEDYYDYAYNVYAFENVTGESGRKNGSNITFQAAGVLTHTTGVVAADGGYAVPTFTDLDGDGDLDLFLGNNYGGVQYFENTGDKNNAVLQKVTCNAHPFDVNFGWRSAPAFVDIDGDGLQDAFVGAGNGYNFLHKTGARKNGDLVEQNGLSMRFYKNTGTATEPKLRSRGDNPFNLDPEGFGAIHTFGDVDGDGDLDAMVGHMSYFFGWMVDDLLDNRKGSVYGKGMFYYENTGSAKAPVYVKRNGDGNPVYDYRRANFTAPAMADLNGDRKPELYVTVGQERKLNPQPGSELYEIQALGYDDQANAFIPLATNPFEGQPLPLAATPSFVDIDGDGDLDAFLGGLELTPQCGDDYLNSTVSFFLNQGTALSPSFTPITSTNPLGDLYPISGCQTITNINLLDLPRLEFADVDGDGDSDLLLGSVTFEPAYGRKDAIHDTGVRYLENTGSKINAVFNERTGANNPFSETHERFLGGIPAMEDFDGDGDLDAMFADWLGRFFYYRQVTTEEAISLIRQDGWEMCFVDSVRPQEETWWGSIKTKVKSVLGL